MQPADDCPYAGYSSYNQWPTRVPSPLETKSFPLGLSSMNHLYSSQATSFSSSGNRMPYPNGVSMAEIYPGMGSNFSGLGVNRVGASTPCPYPTALAPTSYLYNRNQCSDTLASLRLKTQQHCAAGYSAYPGMTTGQPTLSTCQYAPVGGAVDMP